MGIMDKGLLFSDAQAVTATALGDKSIDLWAGNTALPAFPGRAATAKPIFDIGRGNILELLVQVVTAFVSAGGATIQAQLVMADNAELDSNLTVLEETVAVAASTAVAGYQFRLRAVPQGVTRRYLGVKYVVGTSTFESGAVTAALVVDRQSTPSV